MTKHSRLRHSFLIGAASIMFVSAAYADDSQTGASGQSIEQVVVTGQMEHYRGDVSLKDMPIEAQVVSSTQLSDLNITRLDNALDLVSGVSRQNNFGGMWDSFAIRGFAGDENVPSGVLVNGFNEGRGFGGPRDASNIEQIEVLKGPQSALFGRGEPGGTVNIITKKPQFTPQGSIGLSGGSYSTYRVDGDYTAPLDSAIAFRVNGAYENAHSFRDTVKSNKYTVTPSVLANLNSATSFSYELELVHQEVPFDRGVIALNGKLGIIPQSRFLGDPANGPIKVDVLGHQVELQHKFSANWTALVGFGYRDTALKGYGDEPELARSRQMLYVDGHSLSRQRRFRDFKTTDLIPRGEVNGRFTTWGLVHHVLAGIDYDDFSYDSIQNRARPPVLPSAQAAFYAIDIYNPVYGNLPTPGPFQSTLEKDQDWGAYLHDQIDITDAFKIRFGGRYDDFTQSITDRLAHSVTHQADTAFSPEAGAVYTFSPSVSVYTAYGKGFRPNTGSNFYGQAFQPEKTTSYEVGTKLQTPDGKLSGTVALYDMTKSNILTSDPVNVGYSLAVGEAESKGVEVDATGQLPGDIQLWLSYAYIDAKVTKSVLDPDFGRVVAAGAPLINIPANSGSIMLSRNFLISDTVLMLGAGVNYVDKRLGETGTAFNLPAYTLVKFMAALQPTDNLRITLTVNNLFDKVYYPSSYSQLWVTPGAPREFTISAKYSF